MKPKTRQGNHGTQYLYRIHYRDSSGDGPVFTAGKWAYSAESAELAFYDPADPYWDIIKIETVKDND